jgi:DsbC/DsbD-like thiol-disulfide interchange protein
MMYCLLFSLRRQHAEKVAAVLLFLQATLPAQAADASRWDSGPHSAVRLIAADATTDAGMPRLRAGIQVQLAAGWKTYWRYPGDSGVPPRFDFSRSDNVKQVVVAWPAPHRFTEGGDTSIGYKGDVTFPLRVVAQDPRRPTVLRLDLDYAICEKMCVPATAKAELVLSGGATAHEATLAAAEASVPKPAALGDSGGEHGSLAIRSVKREADAPLSRVIVDVAVPDGATDVELFAEGPTADWALPVPEPIAGAPAGERRFAFKLDGLPSGASAQGAALRLTAVADGHAIEAVYRLD